VNKRHGEAAARFAERRRREDAAQRLAEVVPNLDTLRLEIAERRAGAPVADVSHIRRIVVAHAPALFVVPCGDPACKDGGHDLTDIIMHGLRSHSETFEGEDSCTGQIGTADCHRVMHCVAIATYKV
jgi:hypothetical protein